MLMCAAILDWGWNEVEGTAISSAVIQPAEVNVQQVVQSGCQWARTGVHPKERIARLSMVRPVHMIANMRTLQCLVSGSRK